MFTGLPAIPTSLARWFLVDQGREARFPGRHNKNIEERGSAGWNNANKRFFADLRPWFEPRHIYWIMYISYAERERR